MMPVSEWASTGRRNATQAQSVGSLRPIRRVRRGFPSNSSLTIDILHARDEAGMMTDSPICGNSLDSKKSKLKA